MLFEPGDKSVGGADDYGAIHARLARAHGGAQACGAEGEGTGEGGGELGRFGLRQHAEGGEPFDLAVLVDFQIDDLIKSGKILAETRADIMSSGISVAVKRGAPKPDISTVEAFKQTLLNAKSITYLKEGASTIHLRKVFNQLGIADAIKSKAVETAGEEVSEFVADGKVELGLIVTPNIMSVPGAELVGPLPAEINSVVMFTAGVSARARRNTRTPARRNRPARAAPRAACCATE